MLDIVQWFATGTGIVAAIMVSLDLGRRLTGWGFALFTVSSIAWIAAGLMDEEASLATQNAVLLVVNVIGVWRWLLRPGKPAQTSP